MSSADILTHFGDKKKLEKRGVVLNSRSEAFIKEYSIKRREKSSVLPKVISISSSVSAHAVARRGGNNKTRSFMHNFSKTVLCTTYLLRKYSEIDVLDFML